MISFGQYIQSLIGTIKILINSLRHTVSESTFVFYSSSESLGLCKYEHKRIEGQGIANLSDHNTFFFSVKIYLFWLKLMGKVYNINIIGKDFFIH